MIPDITRLKSLETHAVLAIACGVGFGLSKNQAFLYAAGALILIGLLIPPLARQITRAWSQLGELLGAIMSRVVLSILFYLVLTPIALLYRIFQRDKTMRLRKDHDTYLVDRDHTYSEKDFANPW